MTDWFSVHSGVRQGDNLAPTLFAMYIHDFVITINELHKGISIGDRDVSCLLYADDIVLLAETPVDLQVQLDAVNNWCRKWRLKINVTKTKIMHFRKNSANQSYYQFHIGSQNISYCDTYRYLGMELNDTLDYTHSVNILSDASSRALRALIARYYSAQGLHYSTYTKLYNSLITPVMDYGSAIWGYKDYARNNTVQHKAMRCFLGVGRFTAMPAIYGEMAWRTPQYRHHLDMVRYFVRLINMDKTRLPYHIFMWEYNRPRQGTWCHEIKVILEQCGLIDCYNTLNPGTINMVAHASRALATLQAGQWELKRHMPKLDTYNKIKTTFCVSNYVFKYLNRNQRSAIARLYSGNLPLRIETGRYRNIPRPERLCVFCDSGHVEDEIHFITECALHAQNRDTMLEQYNIDDTMYTSEQLFIHIHVSGLDPKPLCNYIIKALNARRLTTV